MPESPRDIRRRIRATKNMAQITRAMQQVATARLRRAQNRVSEARPTPIASAMCSPACPPAQQ